MIPGIKNYAIMDKDLEIYDQIERYLDGDLKGTALERFEKLLQTDQTFREEVALHRDIYALKTERSSEINEYKELLNKVHKENQKGKVVNLTPKPETRPTSFRWLQAVAAVLLLGCAIYFLMPSPSLYDQYAQHTTLKLSNRSNSTFTEIENTFNSQQYTKALPLLEAALQANPNDYDLRLYTGICQLELKDYKKALTSFEWYENSPANDHHKGTWYKALTYLKMKDLDQAKQSLNQLIKNGTYKVKEAKELLEKMQ